MAEKAVRITPNVELVNCVIDVMDDGSRYLVNRDTDERICRAYGFEKAKAGTWRSKTSFWTKDGEEGFWCAYDDREVVDRLD